ncbi:uncharacterized protein [Nicotiana tomentosiformis]|uniref:uncharacterized protein n=1 Tax=Nicotiana tomentosiformis TaxID=4098 RepID=UPI00388CB34A
MDELRKAKPFKVSQILVKKPVTKEEAEEFLKKMKVQDYSIVEQLRKTPAQISLLSLLIHSDDHCKALMKILNEAHVPYKITVNHMEKLLTRSSKQIGSPSQMMNFLWRLKICTKRIHMNSVCVQGFDGGGKDYVGDIMLELSIGPIEFTMEFQVLDVVVSYNLLLGRPWIHAAKAIPSSLHQLVKFEWDGQEIVVHGDEDISSYNDPSVPFIEAEDDNGPWVYQTFETMSVEKISKGECIPGTGLSSVSVMVANKILKNGFVPGKGLGSSLQVPKPVVDVDEELIKRFQRLFDDVNMVEIGEGSSNVDGCNPDFYFRLFLYSNHSILLFSMKCNFLFSVIPNSVSFYFYAGSNDMTCMRNFQPSLKSQFNLKIIIQEVEYDEEVAFEEISQELKYFEEKPNPNLNVTEAINLVDQDNVRETKISVHLEPQVKEEIIKKLRKFKTDISVTIKEEITKQLGKKVIRVTQYPTWLANVVPVPKKDGKTWVCVDYRDLNKASPNDNFPLPNIHILIGFMVSRRGIESDPSKIRAIQELPPPKNKIKVMSLLRRLNYISRFIAQLTTTREPIFKLLKKNVAVKWTDKCQEAFYKIKRYLSNPPVLVPPEPGRPLILYLTVLDNSFGCVLGQHDITGKKEQAIYYLSKKFTPYKVKYTLLERTSCTLTWVEQKLKHYLLSYTTYLISRMDPLKYIFQKPMPTYRLAKWQNLLIELKIIYVTQTAMKAQALADHLAENSVDGEYAPLKTYFPDEEVLYVDEVDYNEKPCWKLFLDGAANMKGVGIGAALISEIGQHYSITAQL